jgi:hypothetical protein
MPPTKELKPELVEIWEKWVLAGMPETAEQAAALSGSTSEAVPYPEPVEVTPTP